MQSEPIFIQNTKLFAIEKKGSYLTVNIEGISKVVKDLEALGQPFSIITKREINQMNPFKDTPEFKELANPLRIASSLECYLREAEVETTFSKREDNMIQYIGVTYGKPAKIEVITDFNDSKKEMRRNVIPCQFYLIKDKF
jgi:hypothetical protein